MRAPGGALPRTLAAVALTAAVLLTAGCAYVEAIGRDPSATPSASTAGSAAAARAVRDAAAATIAAGGADVDLTGQGPARGRPVRTTGEGTVDLAAATAAVTLRVERIGTVEARTVGRRAFAALPPRAVGDISAGRRWVAVTLDAVDRGLFADTVVQLGTGATGNPADVPALLAGVRDDGARRIGTETVEGVATTHYAASVDLAAAATAVPRLRAATERFRAELSTARVPVEVWVDGAGRLRRVLAVLRAPDRPGGGATSTVTFTDPGPRRGVPAPAAREVRDLLGGLTTRGG